MPCDISLEEDVERLAEETQRQFGGANVLCNIAGVHVLRKLHETAAMIIECAKRGDFFIMPHNEAAHKTMRAVIDQRHEELAAALRYSIRR